MNCTGCTHDLQSSRSDHLPTAPPFQDDTTFYKEQYGEAVFHDSNSDFDLDEEESWDELDSDFDEDEVGCVARVRLSRTTLHTHPPPPSVP